MKQANDAVTGSAKSYTLEELVKTNIDSWVNAMVCMASDVRLFKEAVAMADERTRSLLERSGGCPAELETELTCIANRDSYRFDEDGRIVSFCKYHIS